MRFFVIFAILVCLCFPVFSQNANQQRLSALSDSMGTTISRSNDNLADFDSRIEDNANFRVYGSYRTKYEYLMKELQESERKMYLYFRTNDRVNIVKGERDHYESLIKDLESTKSDYDNFVRSVR